MVIDPPPGEPLDDDEIWPLPESLAARGRWVVWRQDDNGNRFEVARYDVRADADAMAATMEARGHKQMYWVAAVE